MLDNGNIEITLTKGSNSAKWWKWAIVGEAPVDPDKIEGSQYVDESLLRRLSVSTTSPLDSSTYYIQIWYWCLSTSQEQQEAEEQNKKESEATDETNA